jgi:hypothetical protein
MNIYARQGDLVIRKLDAPASGELRPKTNIVFAGDSSGHPHTLRGNALMRRDGRKFFVRLAEPTVLEHGSAGGHKAVTLEAGDYEIGPKRERGDAGDRAVED